MRPTETPASGISPLPVPGLAGRKEGLMALSPLRSAALGALRMLEADPRMAAVGMTVEGQEVEFTRESARGTLNMDDVLVEVYAIVPSGEEWQTHSVYAGEYETSARKHAASLRRLRRRPVRVRIVAPQG